MQPSGSKHACHIFLLIPVMNNEGREAAKGYIAEVITKAFRKKPTPEPAAQASASLETHLHANVLAASMHPTPRVQDTRPGVFKASGAGKS